MEFPCENFFADGVLLDVCGRDPIPMKPEYFEIVPERSAVLLYTGFGARYHEPAYFTAFPSMSRELAEFLISRRVKFVGMDTPSPDHAPYAVHKLLLNSGMFVLENLTNLEALAGCGTFEVIALPLKLRAEASMVRAVCRA
jgi:kynurenine formamidase